MTFSKLDQPEQEFEGDSFLREIAGLTFAGAALEAPASSRNPYAADLAALTADEEEEAFNEASADEGIFDAADAEALSNA